MGSTTVRPMVVQRWNPCVALRPYVEAFGVREAEFGSRQAYVPLPARRDCFLEFYLQGRYRVKTITTRGLSTGLRVVCWWGQARSGERI